MPASAARLLSQPARSGFSISRASAPRSSPLLLLRNLSSTGTLRPSPAWQRNVLVFARSERVALTRRLRISRFSSNKSSPRASNTSRQTPNPTPHLGSPEPALSLTQRFKKLSREYGWLAVWVYLGLTALDLPLCFVAVRTLGVERIGHYEHVIVESLKNVLRIPFPNLWTETEAEPAIASDGQELAGVTAREGNGALEQAVVQDGGAGASIWTQLALAYAVHKSLIFIRIPLTAAVLPKVAKTLRAWGYTVGRAKPK